MARPSKRLRKKRMNNTTSPRMGTIQKEMKRDNNKGKFTLKCITRVTEQVIAFTEMIFPKNHSFIKTQYHVKILTREDRLHFLSHQVATSKSTVSPAKKTIRRAI